MTLERIRVGPGAEILAGDVRITAARAGGPGGQNVNKVATMAVLAYRPAAARGLSPAVREKLLGRLRLSAAGEVRLRCQRHRTFGRNREEVLERLRLLLAAALAEAAPRRPTRPGPAAGARRLQEKRVRAARKRSRRRPEGDEP